MSESTVTPRKTIYEMDDQNLIPIPENKERAPRDIELIVRDKPKVETVPYGLHGGMFATTIRLTYSPIPKFPHDDILSTSDHSGIKMTIGTICDIVASKQPRLVHIRGGEAMFKYEDEVKHLYAELRKLDNVEIIITDTCGAYPPDDMLDYSEFVQESAGPDHYRIFPQISRDSVEPNEYYGWMSFLRERYQAWMNDPWHVEVILQVDTGTKEDETKQIEAYIDFLREAWGAGEYGTVFPPIPFVFVPKWISFSGEATLRDSVGSYFANFYDAMVIVHPVMGMPENGV